MALNQHPQKHGANGCVEAPPVLSGASPVSRTGARRTEFLPDIPIDSIATAYYAGRRFLLGGAPLGRHLSIILLILAALWATGLLPARWTGIVLFLAALVIYTVVGLILRRRDYIAFRAQSLPILSPQVREPEASLPVYVTGRLSVEGAHRRFTCLPGFYKTFATREHGLLCLVRPRRSLGAIRWPEDEIGMWYAFFSPESVGRVTWGTLDFGSKPMAAIEVGYESCVTRTNRFGRSPTEVCSEEILYLSSVDDAILKTILADMMADNCVDEAVSASQPIEG